MRNAKYWLFSAVTAALVGTAFGVTASAQEPADLVLTDSVDNKLAAANYELSFEKNSDLGGYEVSFKGTAAGVIEVNIPATYNGEPVVSIAGSSYSWSTSGGGFQNCGQLKKITIPASVQKIGGCAFYGCTRLESVVFKNGSQLSDLGQRAFYGCTNLNDITLPANLNHIGAYAFQNCSKLGNITVPGSVLDIGTEAFSGCTRLASATIKKGVNTIYSAAFKGCTALTSVKIESGSINYEVFSGCSRLAQVTLSEGVDLPLDSGSYYSGDGVFEGCKSLSTIKLPNSVTIIPPRTFYGCSGLKTVNIPKNVTGIGHNSFYGTQISKVALPVNVTYVGESAFESCAQLKTVTLNKNLGKIYKNAFKNCSKLGSITIPALVTEIGENAFEGCKSLTTAKFSTTSLNTISNELFLGCSKLKTVNIPVSVTTIEYSAFKDCIALASIKFSDNVTEIGYSAFQNCDALKTVYIPASISTVGYAAFYDCDGLTSATIDNIITLGGSWYGGAFESCDKLESVIVSASTVNDDAFKNCPRLKNVTITDYVQNIGSDCFANCKALTTVTLPNGLLSIPNSMFYYCTNLKTVNIPGTVSSIGNSAFYGCNSLKKINFGGSKSDWESITKGYSNDKLNSVSIAYNQKIVVKPAAMANFKAAVSGKNVVLSWYKNPSAKTYQLTIKKNGKQVGKVITLKSTAVKYTMGNYDKNSSYTFTMVPVNGKVKGSATTVGLVGKLTGVKYTSGKVNISLTWTKNPAADSYKIATSVDNGKIWKLSGTTKKNSFNITGLTANKTYKVRIIGYRNGKAGVPAILTVKTKMPIAKLKAAPDKTTVKLAWGKLTSAKNYKISVWKNNKWTLVAQTKNNTTLTYTVKKLTANKAYKFRVAGYDKSGKMIAYTDVTTKTKGNITSLKATPGKNAVKLTWKKNTSAKYYRVYVVKNGKWTKVSQTKNNSTVTCLVKKLSANKAYKFRVAAYNKSDNMIAYSDISVKTKK